MAPDEEIQVCALHDRQRFVVERFDDWLIDKGDAELFVKWKLHSDEERTWEPLIQLVEDVSVLVKKYVANIDNVEIQNEYDEAVAMVESQNDTPAAADVTTEAHTVHGQISDRVTSRHLSQCAR